MAALQCDICGGKLIGKAGGIFECDSCGMEYDTTWAKQKIQEIKGTVKVEGTVEVTGTVKLDGPVEVKGGINVENLLKRIHICAQDREFQRINELVEQILNLEPECGEAYLWLLLAEKKMTHPDQLFRGSRSSLKELGEHKNWKNALRYLPAEESAGLEQKLADAIAAWETEDPQVRQRNREIRPVQNMIHEITWGGIAALKVGGKANGSVYIACADSHKWLRAASNWIGIKELVSFRFGMLLGIGWDGTVRGVCKPEKPYQKLVKDVEKWEDIVLLALEDNSDCDVVVGLRSDGTVVSTYLDPYKSEGGKTYYLKKGGNVYFALNAVGWNDVVHINVVNRQDKSGKNMCYFLLGLTSDGRIRVSDTSGVPHFDTFWDKREQVEQWTDVEKYCWGCSYQLRDGICVNAISGRGKEKYMDYPIYKGGVANIGIAQRDNEVKNVVACCSHAAILADGSVVADIETKRARTTVQGEEWKNMVSISEVDLGADALVGVREDGRVLLAWFDKPQPGVFVQDWKLFGSLDTLEQEREEARIKALEAARERREQEARQKEEERRRREEKARRKEEERRLAAEKRQQQIMALRKEKLELQTELSNLRGFFTGRRRREIEGRISEIEAQLKSLT